MKKRISPVVWIILFLCTILFARWAVSRADSKPAVLFDSSVAIVDSGHKKFPDVKAADAVREMGAGWNLGNTLDATDGGNSLQAETSWGQPLTTQAMIHNLAASGIRTLRVPVSWANHMNKETYTVDPAWMKRVKQIVDWAIDEGMYVIINSHHDNGPYAQAFGQCEGYYPNSDSLDESERFLVNLWSQIALAFNNGYDEHLIFETMNEPRLRNTDYEWDFYEAVTECRNAAGSLNILNQACVDVIRSTGGNNEKRFISITPLQASYDAAHSSFFKMPNDKEKGRLILSVHMYTPYYFTMASPGAVNYTDVHKEELEYIFSELNRLFVENGFPVIVSEYAATNKDNLDARVRWFCDFNAFARQYGMATCVWDNGTWKIGEGGWDASECFGFYNRTAGTWYFPEILTAILSH